MEHVIDFFKGLFDTQGFVPRLASKQWTGFHTWLYIISDLAICAAFFAIPFIIIRFLTARKQPVAFNNLYKLFAAFIFAAGLTQLIDAILFWYPVYRFSAVLKFATAVISGVTVLVLIRTLPKAFAFKTAKELQAEIDLRVKAEKELEDKNRQLSEAEKIAKIGYCRWDIRADKIILSEEAANIYGISSSTEFSFDSFIAKIHPADQETAKNIIYRIISTKKFEGFHFRIIVNGAVKYLRVKGELRFNATGDIVTMMNTLQYVTENPQSLFRIEQQNNMLMEIASIHSHNVRGPLATIMGLASMFNDKDVADPDNVLIIEGIKVASENLDKIVTDIVQKSWNVELLKEQEALAQHKEVA